MLKQHVDYDQLCLKNDSKFKCLLEENQTVILSSYIWKYNHQNKCQYRVLVVTNQAILNVMKSQSFLKNLFKKILNPYNIRRRIELSSLYGISLTSNKQSNIFIIHVINQHDYYYKTKNNKKQLLKIIAKTYQQTVQKQLPFYFKDQKEIMNFRTLKVHLKQKKQVKPKGDPSFLNNQYFNDQKFANKQYICDYNESQQTCKPSNFKKIEQFPQNQIQNYYYLHQQFHKSIKVINIFESKYILKPSFSFLDNKQQLLFTHFMIGGNLKQFLNHKLPLEKQIVLFYSALLIIILEQLHNSNIVYSNLVLENILVKQNGYLILNGLQPSIRQIENGKKVYTVSGNPHYSPPEVVSCQGFGKQIDLWKLGVCSYFIFTGYYPFDGPNLKTLYYQILNKSINNQNLPDFIVFLLQKNCNKRIKISELKQTTQFKTIDWEKLKNEEIMAPFKANKTTWSGKLPKVYQLTKDED